MQVVCFNGSARKGGNTASLLSIVAAELEAQGIETTVVDLAGHKLAGCIACYKCFETKDGRCAQTRDQINEYIELMRRADGIILGSPTYFSDVTVNMKALMERVGMTTRASGNLLRRKVGAGVVAARRAGAMHALNTLNAFFLISEMIVPGSSYWNIGMGRNPGDVDNDEEATRTMRDLGRNMAWLMKRL